MTRLSNTIALLTRRHRSVYLTGDDDHDDVNARRTSSFDTSSTMTSARNSTSHAKQTGGGRGGGVGEGAGTDDVRESLLGRQEASTGGSASCPSSPTSPSTPSSPSSSPTEGSPPQMEACLGLLDLLSLGVGSCLGTGMYLTAGIVASTVAGPGGVVSFMMAGLASMLTGLCYAELAGRCPKSSGSAYMYAYVTAGELAAFVIGWGLVVEYVIGTAAGACALSETLDSMCDGLFSSFHNRLASVLGVPKVDVVAAFLCLILTWLLASGAQMSARVNNALNLTNLIVLIAFVVLSLWLGSPRHWTVAGFFPMGLSGVMTAVPTCYYAFIGFDALAATGAEARNPSTSIPLSILLSILLSCLAYVIVILTLTFDLPFYLLRAHTAMTDVFPQMNFAPGKYVVAVGAVSGEFAATFGSLFPLPRVLMSMAADGLIFRQLSKVCPTRHTPVTATVVSGLVAMLMSAFFRLSLLIELVLIGTLLAYVLVTFALLHMRYVPRDPSTGAQPPQFASSSSSPSSLLFPPSSSSACGVREENSYCSSSAPRLHQRDSSSSSTTGYSTGESLKARHLRDFPPGYDQSEESVHRSSSHSRRQSESSETSGLTWGESVDSASNYKSRRQQRASPWSSPGVTSTADLQKEMKETGRSSSPSSKSETGSSSDSSMPGINGSDGGGDRNREESFPPHHHHRSCTRKRQQALPGRLASPSFRKQQPPPSPSLRGSGHEHSGRSGGRSKRLGHALSERVSLEDSDYEEASPTSSLDRRRGGREREEKKTALTRFLSFFSSGRNSSSSSGKAQDAHPLLNLNRGGDVSDDSEEELLSVHSSGQQGTPEHRNKAPLTDRAESSLTTTAKDRTRHTLRPTSQTTTTTTSPQGWLHNTDSHHHAKSSRQGKNSPRWWWESGSGKKGGRGTSVARWLRVVGDVAARPTRVRTLLCAVYVLLVLICVLVASRWRNMAVGSLLELCMLGVLSAVLGVLVGVLTFLPESVGSNSFRAPLVPSLPLLVAMLNIFLMTSLSLVTWVLFGLWMSAGLLLYAFYGIKNSEAPLTSSGSTSASVTTASESRAVGMQRAEGEEGERESGDETTVLLPN